MKTSATCSQSKASEAPAALHSADTDRPGYRTSHEFHSGGLLTFTEANEALTTTV